MRNTNTPSFTKVAETRYDIRSLVETLVNPTRNLYITHKFEFQAEKIQIIPHAVQETWYKMRSDLPGLRSHGASIDPASVSDDGTHQVYKNDAVFGNAVLFQDFNSFYGRASGR